MLASWGPRVGQWNGEASVAGMGGQGGQCSAPEQNARALRRTSESEFQRSFTSYIYTDRSHLSGYPAAFPSVTLSRIVPAP